MTTSPAILLDRDGTIVVERGYLSNPADVELERGAARGLLRLQQAGWPLVVVTNQSGIARGYLTREDADAVNRRTAELLAQAGVSVLGWFVCPHGPDDCCDCRKPRPGLALQAAAALDLDLKRSWMIGDKGIDLALGHAVGASSILVRTGYGAGTAEDGARGCAVCADLEAAADHILRDERNRHRATAGTA